MAISSNKFVNVTSNILTETAVARDFSGLVISKGTPLDATQVLGKKYADGKITVVTANTYGDLFAENTDEYKWAANYFSYVSPSGTIPARAKFMKLGTTTGVAATATASVSGSGITDASVTPATFSSAVSAVSGTYEFNCTVSGSTTTWTKGSGSAVETVTLATYGITITGTAADGDKITVVFTAAVPSGDNTPLMALKNAIADDETFGSFTFLSDSTNGVADVAKLRPAADYNVNLNNDYRMVVDYTQESGKTNLYTNYVSKGTLTNNLYGLKGLTLCDRCSYLTMARLAATDYTGTNTTGTDMFKTVSGVDATVTDDDTYTALNDLRLNFIGEVKEHANKWNWYMRGFNMDGTDTAVYDNEMWFKSEIVKDLLTLEGTVEKIPANEQGLSMVSVTIQSSIDMALKNGTILPNKPISESKQLQILQKLGGSSELLSNLLTNGYVLVLELASEGEEYMIKYQVAYLKGDAVRYIEGTHTVA